MDARASIKNHFNATLARFKPLYITLYKHSRFNFNATLARFKLVRTAYYSNI